MNNSVVQIHKLGVSFHGMSVLEDIDLEFSKGEFVTIVGRSGAGKSTLLNALAGFVSCSGQALITGRVGYVFQNYAIFPWLTVADNIAFGLENWSAKDREERVRSLLVRIDMVDHSSKYPHTLSGGQVQRVALARALAPHPDVLLMDEPYAALDHQTRERMQKWLLSIWRDTGRTVLFVTHSIKEAVFLSDRVLILKNKKVAESIEIPFDRPREAELRFQAEFIELRHHILSAIDDNPT